MKNHLLLSLMLICTWSAFAQTQVYKTGGYEFKESILLPATPVKNQAVTGTCWSYTTTSFFESELLRMGKGEYDLSEMHTVRFNYINRLQDNYLREGKGNLGEGSLAHMMFNIVKKHGMVPESVYNGINYNSLTHNHTELNMFVNSIASVPVKLKNRSPEYYNLVNSLLDIYLGPVPEKFKYKGVDYTPISFFKTFNLIPDDYVEITSFSHHPWYSHIVLEIPDNWDGGRFYNLPLDEFIQVIDNSLERGYTVCWDGDMSEKSYSDRMGVAVNPTGEELNSEPGKELSFKKIYKEEDVTQESRQDGFERFVTTDVHLMHLIGKATDQNGTVYYKVKNSWKPEINIFGGYNFLSKRFVEAKTISIVVHKDAIPEPIRKKLGI